MRFTTVLSGSIGICLILSLTSVSATQAGDVRLTSKSVVSFASVNEAKKLLGSKDDFVKRMSPFDRSARMKTGRKVGQSQFLAFAADAARPWQRKEVKKVEQALKAIKPKLAQVRWKLPKRVLMIKTSGREEGHAAYTRGNAIILPSKVLGISSPALKSIIAHEFFHILSRNNPGLPKKTYPLVGFNACGEVPLPKDLQRLKITNPDAPKNDHFIHVSLDGKKLPVVPILFSKTPRYSKKTGGEFFDYMNLRLMVVEKHRRGCKPLYHKKRAVLFNLHEVSDFYNQVGENSAFPIHPEEILADNFAIMMTGRKPVRSPKILKKIQRLMIR